MDEDDRNHRTSPTRALPRTPDVELMPVPLRAVTFFALAAADDVLPLFGAHRPEDDRLRRVIEAARGFVRGAARSNLQLLHRLDLVLRGDAAAGSEGRPG